MLKLLNSLKQENQRLSPTTVSISNNYDILSLSTTRRRSFSVHYSLFVVFLSLCYVLFSNSVVVTATETVPDISGESSPNTPTSGSRTSSPASRIRHDSTGYYIACTKDKGYTYKPNPSYLASESKLAHKLLDGMCGIEIGPSACNPFNLNTIEVGLSAENHLSEFTYYSTNQVRECGDYAKVDYSSDAADLWMFPSSSSDFVLHSHVWEHLPNPLRALEEWVRVTKHGGVIFVIVPHPCASPLDCGRPPTTIQDLLDYYQVNANMSSFDFPERYEKYNGHLHVFNHELLLDIMLWFNQVYSDVLHVNLILNTFLMEDDKVGNGYHISWVVNKMESRQLSDIYYGRYCHPHCCSK